MISCKHMVFTARPNESIIFRTANAMITHDIIADLRHLCEAAIFLTFVQNMQEK